MMPFFRARKALGITPMMGATVSEHLKPFAAWTDWNANRVCEAMRLANYLPLLTSLNSNSNKRFYIFSPIIYFHLLCELVNHSHDTTKYLLNYFNIFSFCFFFFLLYMLQNFYCQRSLRIDGSTFLCRA